MCCAPQLQGYLSAWAHSAVHVWVKVKGKWGEVKRRLQEENSIWNNSPISIIIHAIIRIQHVKGWVHPKMTVQLLSTQPETDGKSGEIS